MFADLYTDRKAAAAIEFGLLGLVTLGLILETMQVALYFFLSVQFEHAVDKGVRSIATGMVAAQSMTADQFRTSVFCAALPGGMDCSRVVLNVRTVDVGVFPSGYYGFVKADQSGAVAPAMDNGQTKFCPGTASAHVYLQAYYAMPVFSPVWTALSSVTWTGGGTSQKVHFISQAAVFRNEPFGASSAANC